MTRRLTGHFREHTRSLHAHPGAALAPYITADVGIGDGAASVAFLLDTGADFTTLSPQDAITVLGWSYIELDFSDERDRVEMGGIGHGSTGALVRDTLLAFKDVEGETIVISLPVAIVEPNPPVPGAHGNWQMPSLLGRDVFQHFDLSLSYHPPSVALTEASVSS